VDGDCAGVIEVSLGNHGQSQTWSAARPQSTCDVCAEDTCLKAQSCETVGQNGSVMTKILEKNKSYLGVLSESHAALQLPKWLSVHVHETTLSGSPRAESCRSVRWQLTTCR
jgi:hypothetical protein